MADEFQIGSGNWWDSSRTRFDSGSSSSSSSSSSSPSVSLSSTLGSFGWPTEMVDMKPRSSSSSSTLIQDTQKLQISDSSDPNLQMMGLGLSSQPMDWNQPLFRGGKAESSFRSLLQGVELSTSTNYHQESGIESLDSSMSEYKQINPGFSLDQPQFSSHISSSDSTVMDLGVYGSSSTMFQGLFGSDNNQPQQSTFDDNRSMNYPYQPNYGMSSNELSAPWSKYPPQIMKNSPPKQPGHGQLQFTNNAPFWNASMPAIQSTSFPLPQTQFPTNFDEKPKNLSENRDLGTVAKKSSTEPSTKRPRGETPSTLPAFKVRKEKMGDRITALQQLVSPFGKTDTASVLSEAIEYIKFLHEQVSVLSTPYMKSGASIQHQKSSDKAKDSEGPMQDLRSRGLCLVPVSSTYPVTHHETTVDFWNPTFGGSFR